MTQVLVTRPLEASQQLAEQLGAVGLSPIVMPLYTFSAREPGPDLAAAWPARGERCLAVFTSPRAVQFGTMHIPKDRKGELEVAVIGSATRASLEASGFTVHLQAGSGYTSEDLLRMPQLASNPGRAIIFCAPGGRQTLLNGLGKLGWGVTMAMVYVGKGEPPCSSLEKNSMLTSTGDFDPYPASFTSTGRQLCRVVGRTGECRPFAVN
jgi:uroporphyrinogen-III synthase